MGVDQVDGSYIPISSTSVRKRLALVCEWVKHERNSPAHMGLRFLPLDYEHCGEYHTVSVYRQASRDSRSNPHADAERPVSSRLMSVLADGRTGRRGANTLLSKSVRCLLEVQISATVEIWLCGSESEGVPLERSPAEVRMCL
jgi:hypothetical protein